MGEPIGVPSRKRRLLARLLTTLAAWLVAFLLVFALLTVFGRELESLSPALDALVFTGVLVPFMGNVVMPRVGGAVTRAVIGPTPTDPPAMRQVGWVESSLVDREAAPRQGDEGSPEAWLVFESAVSDGLRDLRCDTDILVLTWLDRARRDVLRTRPLDTGNLQRGVFSTRSPDRPNPIGLHRVHITAIEGTRLRVRNLEALDGTPILDIKPVLDRDLEK